MEELFKLWSPLYETYVALVEDLINDGFTRHQRDEDLSYGKYYAARARKFEKVQAKKLVKSNKSFFHEIVFLTVLNFFPIQKLIFAYF